MYRYSQFMYIVNNVCYCDVTVFTQMNLFFLTTLCRIFLYTPLHQYNIRESEFFVTKKLAREFMIII